MLYKRESSAVTGRLEMERSSIFTTLLVSLVLLVILQTTRLEAKKCTKQTIYYSAQQYCASTFMWWCTSKGYRRLTNYKTTEVCCPGYTGSDCQTAICNPPCKNGGKCVSPNTCECPDIAGGNTCQEVVNCSHLKPCYPGTCTNTSCSCDEGFRGQSCLRLDASNQAKFSNFRTNFMNVKRVNDHESKEEGFSSDRALWVNWKDKNFLIYFEALFNLDMSPPPSYVHNYSVGIVSANARVILDKAGQSDENTTVRLNTTLRCPGSYNETVPYNGRLKCNVSYDQFDEIIEEGDRLTILAMADVGGFRDLWFDTQFVKQDLYSRVSSQQAIYFLFDLSKPSHCSLSGGCTDNSLSPFKIPNDASKAPFTFDVKGWSDIPSGIEKYTLVVHKLMKKSNSNFLTKEATRNPFYCEEKSVSALPFSKFLPSSSGVYAFILKVTDKANNSEFSRQIAVFDPYSTISTTAESNFFVSSAEKLSNYSWQSRGSYIQFTWKNYFVNSYQVENNLLLPVEEFSIGGMDMNIDEEEENSKGEDVKYIYDDHDGKRTLSGVENVNGITGFNVYYSYISYLTSLTNDETIPSDEPFNLTNTNTTTADLAATNTSTKMQMKRNSYGSLPTTINPNNIENTFAPISVETTSPPISPASKSWGKGNKWIAIRNITQSTFVLKQEWKDGDSINIFVRARDIMSNTKTDSRLVSFDGSPPTVSEAIFTKNVGSRSYKYSSRVSITASDEHSGVRQVRWRLTDKVKQDEIYKEGYLRNDPIQRSECSTIDDCYCIPKGECYIKKMEFDFDNCWLAIDKSLLTKDLFVLEIEAFNQAMLSSEVTRYELGSLTSFDGISDGYGIRNLTSESFGNGTKLIWENVPSCYKVSDVTVLLYNDCDKAKPPRQITLPTTKTEFVLDDLE